MLKIITQWDVPGFLSFAQNMIPNDPAHVSEATMWRKSKRVVDAGAEPDDIRTDNLCIVYNEQKVNSFVFYGRFDTKKGE